MRYEYLILTYSNFLFTQAEEEDVAYLYRSGSDDDFDPSTLPDPDRYRDSDQEADSEGFG